jgi:hypothetical protein
MIDVLVHQYGRLIGRHRSEERMRMRRAPLWSSIGETLDQSGQSRALNRHIRLIAHDERRRRRRVPLHRLIVSERHSLHGPADDPSDEHAWKIGISERGLHRTRAMRQGLAGIHLAPPGARCPAEAAQCAASLPVRSLARRDFSCQVTPVAREYNRRVAHAERSSTPA